MEHLTIETLARLVDEQPEPMEREHLAACESCAAELAALSEQTELLGSLPEILPPKGDWQVVEARLRSEGLVEDPAPLSRLGLARTPSWMPAAAAIVLFLGGAATGMGLSSRRTEDAARAATQAAAATNVEEAAGAVRRAEAEYVSAVARYRTLMAQAGLDDTEVDPVSRYAALEQLVSVSQAAVRQAPGDAYLNGFLASALAERDAQARVVMASDDNWF